MDYCYLRDECGNALVTIAFQSDETHTYYGVVAVSADEDVIEKAKGKSRATSRCKEAIRQKVHSQWGDYQVNGKIRNDFRNSFITFLIQHGFNKLGFYPKDRFTILMDSLITDYKKAPFESKEDAVDLIGML